MIKRTDDELKQIGIDLFANKIFTTHHLKDFNDVMMVFPIYMFLSEEDIETMRNDDVLVLYEYYENASPRSVNGYPIFFSFKYLTRDEWEIVWDVYSKLDEFANNVRQYKE